MNDAIALNDVKVSFVAGFRVAEAFEKTWMEAQDRCMGGYRWQGSNDGIHTEVIGNKLPPFLDDFQCVEEFYLNARSSLMIGEDRLKLERCSPDFQIRLRHHANGEKIIDETPIVVLTYYNTIDILTVTINLTVGQCNVDNLIYLKSLKWDSSPGVHNARQIELSFDDDGEWSMIYFDTVFERICERYFGTDVEILTNADAVLDTISFRGFSSNTELPKEDKDRILYGLITGDEGYELNTSQTIEQLVSEDDYKLDTREYFEYYFNGTSVVADLSEDYDGKKQSFAQSYLDQYGAYPPYDQYLTLDPDIAALEDGMYLFGELALVRFVLLRYIDSQLEETLSDDQGSSWIPRGTNLHDLEETKWNTTSQLTNVDMLTDSVLGIGAIPLFDEMFGYETTRTQVREKLADLNDSIQHRYTRRTQSLALLLSFMIALFGFIALVSRSFG